MARRRASRARRAGPERSAEVGPGARIRLGALLLLVGVLMFLCLGLARSGSHASPPTSETAGDVPFAGYVALPLTLAFGHAALALPFCLSAAGMVLLSRVHWAPRLRYALRLLATTALLACVLEALRPLLALDEDAGGAMGRFLFASLERRCGSTLGRALGAGLLLVAAAFAWAPRPLQLLAGVLRVIARSTRVAGRAVLLVCRHLCRRKQAAPAVPRVAAAPGRGADVMRPRGAERLDPVDNWTPNLSGDWSTAPLEPPVAAFSGPGPDRATKRDRGAPSPTVVHAGPIPLDVLPPSPAPSDSRLALVGDTHALQARIVDVAARTTGLRLAAAAPPEVGLNRILFVFDKDPGQTASVRRIEQAAADVGVETGMAPARISVSDKVRIDLPLPDRARQFAPIRDLLQELQNDASPGPVSYLIGRRQTNAPYLLSCRDARHVLVGGSSGGGKSVALHTMIFGFCFRFSPAQVQLALVDNKVFEFSHYRGLPHLWHDVVTDDPGFEELVDRLEAELSRRKRHLAETPSARFAVLLTIIDEFAGHACDRLVRIVAEARALDMFFVFATQHPTGDVISPAIKQNCVTTIACQCKQPSGSLMLVGSNDATRLLSRGDCLVSSPAGIERVQAGWVTTPMDGQGSDLEALASWIAAQGGHRAT